MTAESGVRSSWLMLARKALLARLAPSAASLAASASRRATSASALAASSDARLSTRVRLASSRRRSVASFSMMARRSEADTVTMMKPTTTYCSSATAWPMVKTDAVAPMAPFDRAKKPAANSVDRAVPRKPGPGPTATATKRITGM